MSEINPLEIRRESLDKVLSHDYRKGPLLLLAGPGTGKTFSLLKTIKHQIDNGYSITDFYEATLTNAAADDFLTEAKEKISESFEASSTLHFRAKGILHRYANELNIDPGFTVIDHNCKDLILRDISAIVGIQLSDVDQKIKTYRNSSANVDPREDDFSKTYRAIQSYFSALDWFDIVLLSCRILEENQQIQSVESSRFKFLLIDEYQDLNFSDQRFVELLLNNRNTLLAVGDDDQSIYSGRCADPSGIRNFRDRYPSARILPLPVTSRIPSNVISASHSLICQNMDRCPKDRIIPLIEIDDRADQGFVISVNNKSDKAEKEFIFQALVNLLGNGILPEQILVLCNCRALGEELIESIQERDKNFPIQNDLERIYDIRFSEYLIDQIRKFLTSPNDNLSLRVIISALSNGFREEESLLTRQAFQAQLSLWQEIQKDDLNPQIVGLRPIIIRMCEVYSRLVDIGDIEEKIRVFVKEFDQLHWLIEFLQDNGDLNENNHSEPTEKSQTGIRFLTIHSSKGLDADFIFIPFLEDSLDLPGNNIEEKRRLLYVALSRAKVGVVMSWAWSRRSGKRFKCSGVGGPVTGRNPSPLISECGVNPNLVPRRSSITSPDQAMQILSHHCEVLTKYDSLQLQRSK